MGRGWRTSLLVISMICLWLPVHLHPKRVYTFEAKKPRRAPRFPRFSRAEVTQAWCPGYSQRHRLLVGLPDRQEIMNTPEKSLPRRPAGRRRQQNYQSQFVSAASTILLCASAVSPNRRKSRRVRSELVSATGSGILLAASSPADHGLSVPTMFKIYGRTLMKVRFSLSQLRP